ncbi:MAG: formate/nitrite transporter family protein [Muribaculaceae bacterium]|nr:formate/nitrite transporter family protein [Muribaculaceae bacterium]
MALKNPAEIIDSAIAVGLAKSSLSISRTTALSILAGAFIALGGILSLVIGYGFPEITAGNPGLQKLLAGLVFPVGLVLVVTQGAELFTGNNAVLIPGYMANTISAGNLLRNWVIVWVGNFIGALAVTLLLVFWSGLTEPEPYHSAIIKIAETKTSLPIGTMFLRGIGANWCVCLAVWMAMAGKTLCDKIAGCWLPVFAFVALGYEHCIANMFFIPAGMLEGAQVDMASLWVNLIVVTAGNIVGGALLVGCVSTCLHKKN